MKDFSILPWEHRGSGDSSALGAQIQLKIGGCERKFMLRMREGVIYFAQPKRAPIWAVTRVFEQELGSDELINAWRAEVARENYGRFVVYRPNFIGTGVNTTLALIHRADYSGWAREWFAPDWRQTPVHRDEKTLDVWGDKFQNATRRAFRHASDALLNRAMEPGERRDIPQRWTRGNPAELEHLFGLAVRLFVRRDPTFGASSGPLRRIFAASSPANEGGWVRGGWLLPTTPDLQISPSFKPLLQLLQEHFVMVGLSWKKIGTYNPNRAGAFRTRWRGNWETYTPEITLSSAIEPHLSAHDKLEAILELRDWLEGKVSPRQSANWLSKALD